MPKYKVRYASVVFMETEVQAPDEKAIAAGRLPGVYEGIDAQLVPDNVEEIEPYDVIWEVSLVNDQPSATLKDGTVVMIGDMVGFKSDYEQEGVIRDITTGEFGKKLLHLYDENGFGGEYLRYATETVEEADRCWGLN